MELLLLEKYLQMGEEHTSWSKHTPICPEAFNRYSKEEKIQIIAEKFRDIMQTLGLDLEDDSLAGTPYRVAKMYVEEVFAGLDPKNMPKVALFENKYAYNEMLIEKNITVHSMCEHHFVPIIGEAHVGYISSGKVIGLSKINRIVKYFCKRPQVQERLTCEIAEHLAQVLETKDVAVIINAKHYCVAMRGIEDNTSTTITAVYKGKFEEPFYREQFLRLLNI
ncbi:MAG: GTP cyclohydrolase I FolE [Bacteroidia bacterium]|nr:GTP cyclohydrolase I FolE [Bacteroidia bacterium]MDW8158193.1 GTP cyclohydrolase I FolE [Bacteroidia bacterium]